MSIILTNYFINIFINNWHYNFKRNISEIIPIVRESHFKIFLWRSDISNLKIIMLIYIILMLILVVLLIIFPFPIIFIIISIPLLVLSTYLPYYSVVSYSTYYLIFDQGIIRFSIKEKRDKVDFLPWEEVVSLRRHLSPGEGPINDNLIIFHDNERTWVINAHSENFNFFCKYALEKIPLNAIWPSNTAELLGKRANKASHPVEPK